MWGRLCEGEERDAIRPVLGTLQYGVTIGFGVGAVLSHIMSGGTERPIMYASKTLNDTDGPEPDHGDSDH